MQIGVQQLPILGAGQMSPFHQALQTAMANYNQTMDAAYKPYEKQAAIAAKDAYSNNIGKQIAATALSSPYAMAMFDSNTIKQMAQQIAGQNPNALKPPGLPGDNPGKQGTGLWDAFKSILSGKEQGENLQSPYQQAPQGSMAGYVPPPAPPPANANNAYGYDGNGNNTVASPQEVSQIANHGNGGNSNPNPDMGNPTAPLTDGTGNIDLTDPKMNAFGKVVSDPQQQSAIAVAFPSPQQKAAEAQQTATVTENAKNTSDATSKYFEDLSKQTDDLAQLRTYQDIAQKGYDQAKIKGPVSHIPGANWLQRFDPKAVEANNAINNMVIHSASALFGSKQSDYRDSLVSASKVEMGMPEEAYHKALGVQEALVDRKQQEYGFGLRAQALGQRDINVIRQDWNQYQYEKPIYDPKTGNIIKKNTTEFAYEDFLKNKYKRDKRGLPMKNFNANGTKYGVYNQETGSFDY